MFWFLFSYFVVAANGIINEPKSYGNPPRLESDYFLPNNIIPSRYQININPHSFDDEQNEPWFEGTVSITFVSVLRGTSDITLNVGEGMNISDSSVRITDSDGIEIPRLISPVDRQVEMIRIKMARDFVPFKEYHLNISYVGIITNAGYGLFRGTYIEPDGIKRYYLGTQLRPVNARQLFPCFDEPKFKATFVLSVSHSKEYIPRSNMPLETTTAIDEFGKELSTFQETPKMSPYLLTLFLFQFSSVDSSPALPTIHSRFKGWAVPSKIGQMEWSQQIFPPLAEIAERYFNYPLPVPKIDQIALPELVVIAMENWGINTYREINVLADQTSPLRQRQTVARFTGHEILHHWIGNLVTLDLWDYLWIQEAFAMYFEYYFPDQMAPEWKMMDQFVTDLTIEGLHGDNTNTPLTTKVVTPNEIRNKFMGLTYTKGPALIRMLNSLVGEHAFESALRKLILKKEFSIMTPQDLWKSFADFSPRIDIYKMMSKWTDQGGYPILFVYRDLNNTSTIIIDQTDSDDYVSSNRSDKLWHVPISYTTQSESNFLKAPSVIMTHKTIGLSEPVSPSDWIILNLRFTGYFRVLYANDIIQLIIQQLQDNHNAVHHLNRAQLIDDIFDFADKSIVSYQLALGMISYLHKERDYVPLRVAFRALNELDARLKFTQIYSKFESFIKLLLQDIYIDIGFDEKVTDQPLDKLNREQVIEWACYYDVEDCRLRSGTLLEKTILDRSPMSRLPADIRTTVMCYAVKNGSFTAQDYFLSEILQKPTSKNTEEFNALACSLPENLITLLNYQIPEERWIEMFQAILAREENAYLATVYLTKNLDSIVQRFGEAVTISFIKELQTKKSLLGINSELAKNLQYSTSLASQPILTALNDLTDNIQKNELWANKRIPDISPSLSYNMNALFVTKYYSNQILDSFHLTKYVHSHLYDYRGP